MNHREYQDAGFKVFGLHGANSNGLCLCDNPECQAPFKHPINRGWQHTPEWDDEQLTAMEMAGQFDTGFGALCDGFIVVDIDARNGGIESYQRLNEDLGGALLSAGMIVRTGSGGGSRHLYYKAPSGVALQTKLTQYPGIDFKSSGYVVGAGSMHASGERYEALEGEPSDIALAPNSLVELLKKPDFHRTQFNDSQIDVTSSDLQGMLAHISPDCDHDQWIKVGMAIHHATSGAAFDVWDDWSSKGAKYPGSKQLSIRWDSFGKTDRPVTIGTLFHYAEIGGWQWPVEFMTDEFKEKITGLFISVDDMMSAVSKPDWIIKGIIERGSSNLLFGESGAGKSLFALDWAFCIGVGRNWNGHRIKSAEKVIYIAGEGHRGLSLRMKALSQKYNQKPQNIYFSQRSVNLLDEKEAVAIAKIIEEMGIQPAVVVIDTLHRNMVGDENKADDVAKYFKSIEIISKKMNCAIVTVHHSGHGDKARARGSSSIKAGMDAEFCVSKQGQAVSFSCTKSKDFSAGAEMLFTINEVELEGDVYFDDDDGKQVTSVFLEYAGASNDIKMGKNDAIILDTLTTCITTFGKSGRGLIIDGDNKTIVALDVWRPFAYEVLKGKNQSRDFDIARKSLKNHGYINSDGSYWWVV